MKRKSLYLTGEVNEEGQVRYRLLSDQTILYEAEELEVILAYRRRRQAYFAREEERMRTHLLRRAEWEATNEMSLIELRAMTQYLGPNEPWLERINPGQMILPQLLEMVDYSRFDQHIPRAQEAERVPSPSTEMSWAEELDSKSPSSLD
jgi:hypothetical protein